MLCVNELIKFSKTSNIKTKNQRGTRTQQTKKQVAFIHWDLHIQLSSLYTCPPKTKEDLFSWGSYKMLVRSLNWCKNGVHQKECN